MRKAEREITDKAELWQVLRRCDTVRVAMYGPQYPYIVPLSFGLCDEDGMPVLYVHGAKEGYKHVLLQQNGNVCIETDILHRYAQTPTGITAVYESVIGFGTACRVRGQEARKGLDLLLEHCGYAGHTYPDAMLQATAVYKITLHSLTGKRRTV